MTVVIVNFNSGGHLRSCLDAVAACVPDARVLIIDNASTDRSDDVDHRPGVVVQRNADNRGFARAVNQALGMTAADDVLLLNPDCRLSAGVVERLTLELERHAECAIAAPEVLNEDGSVQGNARGDPDMLTGLFGRSTLLTKLLPSSRLARRNVHRDAPADTSREVDWVSGACMLMRRGAVEAVGGFDERYFLYWEDADLCRRLRARGCTIRHVPTVHVVHAGGGSSRAASALALREFHRSAYLYYTTHVGRSALKRALAKTLLGARYLWKRAGGR